ncbi:MAG: Re/Si-specific NAD(P)(+) transhydrogenase subunit alpha [bacterium]
MKIGIPHELRSGEQRVALIPEHIPALKKAGLDVWIQNGAGEAAGFPDSFYQDKGAELSDNRNQLFSEADVILQVNALGTDPQTGRDDFDLYRENQTIIAFLDPLSEPGLVQEAAQKRVHLFSMELMPRITRAQSMDALSSMATIAGYKAVLLAAEHLPKMFPMMMTAAGTITPAKVYVIGAGVAGLQACATARRLGAVVSAYDVRPAVKDQVQSVGAKFIELELEAEQTETAGGYAKELGEDFYRRQRELMTRVVAENNVVITTAAIPGKKAPILVTADMVRGMAPGSVVIDLAAERGGNCELTRAGEVVYENGVKIIGPVNIPATVAMDASRMYSKNITTFLLHLVKEGQLDLERDDEIIHNTLLTRNGEVVHPQVRSLLDLPGAEEES